MLLFAELSALSQERKDYIIRKNKDTAFVKIVRIDKKMRSFVCEENGKKIRHDAKDISALKYDSVFYESASVRLKALRSKRSILLQGTVKGKLNLYETGVKKRIFLWKNFGEDLIRLRLVYRAQPWIKDNLVTIYFYRKENEPGDHFSKSWQEKTKDCKSLYDKLNSKAKPWNPAPPELVRFYNSNCN